MARHPQKPEVMVEDDRTGTSVATLKQAILDNLYYVVAKTPPIATEIDYYTAVAYTVRDRMLAQWIATLESYSRKEMRAVAYLSAEFLMGPYLAHGDLERRPDGQVLVRLLDLRVLPGNLGCEVESRAGANGYQVRRKEIQPFRVASSLRAANRSLGYIQSSRLRVSRCPDLGRFRTPRHLD